MAEFNGNPIFSIPSGKEYDIVKPAVGSRPNATFVPSTPGLVKLYNSSAGLAVNEYGELGIVAASEFEIDKKESERSLRLPIVPKNMPYAMARYSYQDDLSKADTELPPGAKTVADFVSQYIKGNVMPNLIGFKVAVVPREGTFSVKPGMMGIAMPASNASTSKTLQFKNDVGAQITNSYHATTIFFSTDKGADPAAPSTYRPIFLFIDGLTSTSYHNSYTGNCTIVNKCDGSGNNSGSAYIFYISRSDV